MKSISNLNFGKIKKKLLGIVLAIVMTACVLDPLSASTAGTDTVSQMKKALKSKDMSVFQISGDIVFEGKVYGVFTTTTNYNTTSVNMTTQQAQGAVLNFLYNKVIRVCDGKATMDDNDFECYLGIEPGEKSVGITIVRGNSTSVNQGLMNGSITGNTLTGIAQVDQNILFTNSLTGGSGNGYSARGDFSISIVPLPADQWPPMPPKILSMSENEDWSVKLTWEDPNPNGVVAEYDIFREDGIATSYNKVATVSNCTSWSDTSEYARTTTWPLSYYMVARAKNGKESKMSNFVFMDFMNRLFRY